MARRNLTTELGCIACEDLTELGAGKEGWLLNNPNLLAALDTHSLALANRSIVLILHWSEGSDPVRNRVKIVPELSPIEAEYISAIAWLVFDDIKVLALGTSRGYLLTYSLRGDLIHKQVPFFQIHSLPKQHNYYCVLYQWSIIITIHIIVII